MKRSRVIGAIAAALVAGLVLGGVGISMAGPRTATPVPNGVTAAPVATTAAFGMWGQPAQSKAATVAPASRAKGMMARASNPAPRHQTATRKAAATTRRTTTRSGNRYYCTPHETNHHGSRGGCW